jgi:hypothetical protein
VSDEAAGAGSREPCSNEQPASATATIRPAAKRARKARFETILHPACDQLERARYNRMPISGAGRLNVKLCARSRAGQAAGCP